MKVRWRIVTLLVGLSILAINATAHGAEPAKPVNGPKTPLDEYVAKPDPTYSWSVVKTIPGDGYTTFILDLKSQSWRAPPEVSHSVWQHWLIVVKPDKVAHDTALLMITGGSNGGPPPGSANPQSIFFAKSSESVVAELKMIPNEPITFNGDGHERKEDDLIAYCWVKYMQTGDATWLPRLPMVKSAVRAMDATTELMASEQGGQTALKHFVVTGGFKRGWTTWLTGAVDHRVSAIIPLVIDVVNVRACSINHYSAYGFWANAIGDYTKHKVQEWAGTPQHDSLLRIVDPYFYRNRMTMPKFIVNASGDQYFPPDSSKFYYDDLPGVKYLRYVPNANHSLGGSDAPLSILAFYQAILNKSHLPKFSWNMQKDGSILVRTEDKPIDVSIWQATDPEARDFRVDTIGRAYKQSHLDPQPDGTYLARVPKPAAGWTAFFVELTFSNGKYVPFKFSTQVSVVPNVYPHSYEDYVKTLKKK